MYATARSSTHACVYFIVPWHELLFGHSRSAHARRFAGSAPAPNQNIRGADCCRRDEEHYRLRAPATHCGPFRYIPSRNLQRGSLNSSNFYGLPQGLDPFFEIRHVETDRESACLWQWQSAPAAYLSRTPAHFITAAAVATWLTDPTIQLYNRQSNVVSHDLTNTDGYHFNEGRNTTMNNVTNQLHDSMLTYPIS